MTEDRSIKPNDALYIVFELKREEVERLCGRGYYFGLWLVSDRIGLPVWTYITITGKLEIPGQGLQISGTIEVDDKARELYFIAHLGKTETEDKAKYAGVIRVSESRPCLSFAACASGRTVRDARRFSVSPPVERHATSRTIRDARRGEHLPPLDRDE